MKLAKSLYYFYNKLILPALLISIIAGFVSYPIPNIRLIKNIIIAYVFISPFVHLYFYEIKNPEEYNFYYNMGLSKNILWGTTISVSIILALTLIFI